MRDIQGRLGRRAQRESVINMPKYFKLKNDTSLINFTFEAKDQTVSVRNSSPAHKVGFGSKMQLQWHNISHLLLALPAALKRMADEFPAGNCPAEMAREACVAICATCGEWDATKSIGYIWTALTCLNYFADDSGEFLGIVF